MTDRLKTYAHEQGLDPSRAGEVLLTAATATSVIGDSVTIDPEELEEIGIAPEDSRKDVIRKIRAAIETANSPETLQHFSEGKLGVSEMAAEVIRYDLEGVLSWLEEN